MINIKKTLSIIFFSFTFIFMSAFTSGIDYVHNRNRFVVDIVEHKGSVDNRINHGYIVDFDYQNSQVHPKYVVNGGQTVYIYRNGSLVFEVTNKNDGVNHEHFYTSELGSYRLVRLSRTGEIIVDYSFKIVDGGLPSKSLDFSSDNPSSPTNKINDSITGLSNSLGEKIADISTDFKSSLEKLDDIRSKVGSAISQLDSVNSNLSKLNNDLNNNFNNALAKMDITNNHLNDIKNNLNTDKPPASYNKPNTDNILDSNRPNQNENPYEDNNQYFHEKENINITDKLPNPNQDIEKWEGVNEPEQQMAEQELNKEDELSKETEFQKDEELEKDTFQQDEELEKDTFQQDKELEKDIFQQDKELERDTFQQDKELEKDTFQQDEELEKDNFNNTENYDNSNYFNQTEKYEADIFDYGLRWKSVKGKFE